MQGRTYIYEEEQPSFLWFHLDDSLYELLPYSMVKNKYCMKNQPSMAFLQPSMILTTFSLLITIFYDSYDLLVVSHHHTSFTSIKGTFGITHLECYCLPKKLRKSLSEMKLRSFPSQTCSGLHFSWCGYWLGIDVAPFDYLGAKLHFMI